MENGLEAAAGPRHHQHLKLKRFLGERQYFQQLKLRNIGRAHGPRCLQEHLDDPSGGKHRKAAKLVVVQEFMPLWVDRALEQDVACVRKLDGLAQKAEWMNSLPECGIEPMPGGFEGRWRKLDPAIPGRRGFY